MQKDVFFNENLLFSSNYVYPTPKFEILHKETKYLEMFSYAVKMPQVASI